MLEKLKYINHLNETLTFGSGGLYVNTNELHDYSWDYTTSNNRITSFSKGIQKKKIPVVISCMSEAEGISIRNKLFEIAEKDVLLNEHGKLIIGDYYMKCFVTESKKTEYIPSKQVMNVELTITTDFPVWVKENETDFGFNQYEEGTDMDYNSDYDYDYTTNLTGISLINTSIVPSNFRMTIFGAINDPKVIIDGHLYEVDVEVGNNEQLVIDSMTKTITLIHSDGSTENCFDFRNRDSYIFEKIKAGYNEVQKTLFKFRVVVFDERSEPKWT